ncbi:MAG: glycoside hydrolase family 3 N-terminal domain-containing protein, partial [Catenibacillus sp.]|nr:glycoside hydrolase family 3 N-terminal domain-containing protein [Catenibacillus sp.]
MNYENILKKMTLEQKCVILSGADVFKTYAFESPEIPAIWLSDGPHGLRKQAGASDHLGLNPSEEATCFPTAAAAACSWDEALGEEIGEALGREAAAQGVNVVLGPGLNMKRNPLCGRNFEYFSEDPYLAGKMAAAYIRGIQKQGIAACPKHFAVNNQELRRMASDSIVDERTLREIYLTGFEIAVKEGHPKAIMSSYNLVNGVYANENKHLLNDILRKNWGFDGAVVTDWGGSNNHVAGAAAGSSLEMPAPGLDSARSLIRAVHDGSLSEETVNQRVAEVLKLVCETDKALRREHEKYSMPKLLKEHRSLAGRAAAGCMTLLKNDDGFLPFSKETKA